MTNPADCFDECWSEQHKAALLLHVCWERLTLQPAPFDPINTTPRKLTLFSLTDIIAAREVAEDRAAGDKLGLFLWSFFCRRSFVARRVVLSASQGGGVIFRQHNMIDCWQRKKKECGDCD
jgi:hypothetical protein